jgi:glutamyl-tRNA synthetase
VTELSKQSRPYRGRLAPSPTGLLHIGHAQTFWIAAQRALQRGGTLILRNEDLDSQRCRAKFVDAMIEDLRWLEISWQEGPDCGGRFGPYTQSERRPLYLEAWKRLLDVGAIYPCTCSRKDVALAAGAPNDGDDEPLYSGKCRPAKSVVKNARPSLRSGLARRTKASAATQTDSPVGVNWRFRVPDGEEICFIDLHLGPQCLVAGRDLGDFIVWRRDDVPAYQLAVVADDAAMGITEVVRGADLLKSTARQILLYRALGLASPEFYHCDLVRDEVGVRLAKRHDSLSIRKLREMGWTPEEVRAGTTPARI